jgi:enoyl-CoA hydratase/carnithine racemase
MAESELLVALDGAVLTVTFNRPDRRNAMTWAMYDQLTAACERADRDDAVRVMVLRGAGGKAFVAGTDIAQFRDFRTGADGVAYEQRILAVVSRLERVTVPTIATVQGHCIGAGLIIASVCDLRLATRSARFGAPIARTLGNCLSMNSYSLLLHHLGPGRTLDLMLRGRLLTGEEAHAAGYVAELCADDTLGERVAEATATVQQHAPLTMWAAKEAVRRLRVAQLPDGDDIVSRVFGSADFHTGVQAFTSKQQPEWIGR